MKFLNSTVANDLQYLTLIFEVVGFTLAFIEIKYPKGAHRIERGFKGLEKAVQRMSYRMAKNPVVQTLITIFILLLFAAVIPTVWGLFSLPSYVWWMFSSVGIAVGAIIGLHLAVDFLDSLNRFSNGKAIGALGVCLGSLGIMGEIYQILVLWYG